MMINSLVKLVSAKRAKKISKLLRPYLKDHANILDFGCGNLLIAERLCQHHPLTITGIDVIDINLSALPLKLYDGQTIPFGDKSFDITYAAYVLHHTTNIEELLEECVRVTKYRLIILEDVYVTKIDLMLTKLLDYTNLLVSTKMNLPLNFKREQEWLALFAQFNPHRLGSQKISPATLRPTRHRQFVLDLEHYPTSIRSTTSEPALAG